jgi:hypothetical protein
MQKTPFAGLTELDISESLLEDGGAFTGRDRETIDRFLQMQRFEPVAQAGRLPAWLSI